MEKNTMNLNPFSKENVRALFTARPKTGGKVSPAHAKTIGNSLFVDWHKVSVKTLTQGMNIELEHKSTLQSLGVKEQDLFKAVARIALDHLNEDLKYYEKLKKMEGK